MVFGNKRFKINIQPHRNNKRSQIQKNSFSENTKSYKIGEWVYTFPFHCLKQQIWCFTFKAGLKTKQLKSQQCGSPSPTVNNLVCSNQVLLS